MMLETFRKEEAKALDAIQKKKEEREEMDRKRQETIKRKQQEEQQSAQIVEVSDVEAERIQNEITKEHER